VGLFLDGDHGAGALVLARTEAQSGRSSELGARRSEVTCYCV
jgi:hypothetical protein